MGGGGHQAGAEVPATLAGIVARLAQGALARAWEAWLAFLAERALYREQLQAALAHWSARELASAFNQFRCCPWRPRLAVRGESRFKPHTCLR